MATFGPKANRVVFESLGINKAPEGLQTVLDCSKSTQNAMLLEDQGKYWVFLARGLKPTGGFAVKVADITIESMGGGKQRLRVLYRHTDPAPGQFVTQVMTYPTDLVLVKGLQNKPDEIIYTLVK